MANRMTVPGISQSHGIQRGDYLFDAGDYKVKLRPLSENTPEGKNMTIYQIQGKVLDGPKQSDGESVKGRLIRLPIFFLHEDHPSYSPDLEERSIGQLAQLCAAAGVKPNKNDEIDFEKFADQEVWIRLYHRADKRTGEPRMNIGDIQADKSDLRD